MKKSLLVISAICVAVSVSMAGDKLPADIPKWMRFVELTGSNVNLRMEPSNSNADIRVPEIESMNSAYLRMLEVGG